MSWHRLDRICLTTLFVRINVVVGSVLAPEELGQEFSGKSRLWRDGELFESGEAGRLIAAIGG